jgi:hypothetical protein
MSDQQQVVPQILTRSALQRLSSDLDAGDVLECYLLSRSTPLHGLVNSTITVTKQALGLRYRPRADTTGGVYAEKDPLELTLEYGPMRAGATLSHESIPRVVRETELSGETAYVSWENEGKVYYTTAISSGYLTANYLASLTGAVLNDLLLTAVEYAEQHRRYQPFAVYQKEHLLLRSSSDTDFINSLWKHLANVGVELAPVIQPVQWELRLQADSVDKVQVATVQQAAHFVSLSAVADFYSQLYQCLEAVATSNYSFYDAPEPSVTNNTDETSMVPSTMPSLAPSLEQPPTQTAANNNEDADDGTLAPSPGLYTSAPPTFSDTTQTGTDNDEDPPNRRWLKESDDTSKSATLAPSSSPKAQPPAQVPQVMSMNALLYGDSNAMASAAATCLQDPRYGIASSAGDTASTGDNSSSTTPPTTTVYLYWDGSFYYRVNLTAPYLKVVPVTATMPHPPHTDVYSGGGNFVDWTLALMILGLFAIFILLLLQQILGRNLRIIRPLYKFQRWFFDPLEHTLDDMVDDEMKGQGTEYTFGEDVIPLSMGGRKPFTHESPSSSRYQDFFPAAEAWLNGDTTNDVELEMTGRAVTRSSSGNGGLEHERSNGSINRMGDESLHHSYHSEESDSGMGSLDDVKGRLKDDMPVRLARDPDLVDLPDLKRTSKVAVPVSLSEGSGHLV